MTYSTGSPGFLPARIGNGPITMSSREIAELVDSRHDDVKRSIDRLVERGVIAQPPMADVQELGGNNRIYVTQEYRVSKRDSYVIVAQLSPEFTARLVDRWQELEEGQGLRLPTTAEAFASVFSMVADQERRHAEQEQQIKAIEAKVDQVAQTQLLKVKPQNAENVTEIRKRIAKRFGLPVRVINEVMAQMPYSPKPAGMVKNANEKAEGSSYAIYWIRDVTAVFKRFVGDCQQVSPSKWMHPDIGKFTRVKPAA